MSVPRSLIVYRDYDLRDELFDDHIATRTARKSGLNAVRSPALDFNPRSIVRKAKDCFTAEFGVDSHSILYLTVFPAEI